MPVWRLDRWGRSVTDLLATLQELEYLCVGFVSLTEALDLTTPAGRAMAGLLAIFAEFEREILREPTRAGLAHARENAKRPGRPATAAVHAAEIRKLHRAGVSKSENRPPHAHRPHLGSLDLGLTYFPEIGCAGLPKAHRAARDRTTRALPSRPSAMTPHHGRVPRSSRSPTAATVPSP
ncbi:MAG TPA: recombinase family protein [Bryobacteraceae bacterium]|nr:recombinase family protein [Bryobacteraceae bacterium]